MSGGSFEANFKPLLKGPVKVITSNNIGLESSKEYQWGTPAKNSFAKNINQELGGDMTHPANNAINVNRKQPNQFLTNTDTSNLNLVVQQTSQSATETPHPLLIQEMEEGHIMHEINHLKSNSKPTDPMDISIQLRRESVEKQNGFLLGRRKMSQLGQYQDQANIASSK